jgi:hypothetical protein
METLHIDVLQCIVVATHHRDIPSLGCVSRRFYDVCRSDSVWHEKLFRRLGRRIATDDPRARYRSSGTPRVFLNGTAIHTKLSERKDVVRVAATERVAIAVTLEGDCILANSSRVVTLCRGEDALVRDDAAAILHDGVVTLYSFDEELAVTMTSVSDDNNVKKLIALVAYRNGSVLSYLTTNNKLIELYAWTRFTTCNVVDSYVSMCGGSYPAVTFHLIDGRIRTGRDEIANEHVKKHCRLTNRHLYLVDDDVPELANELVFTTDRVADV